MQSVVLMKNEKLIEFILKFKTITALHPDDNYRPPINLNENYSLL